MCILTRPDKHGKLGTNTNWQHLQMFQLNIHSFLKTSETYIKKCFQISSKFALGEGENKT